MGDLGGGDHGMVCMWRWVLDEGHLDMGFGFIRRVDLGGKLRKSLCYLDLASSSFACF